MSAFTYISTHISSALLRSHARAGSTSAGATQAPTRSSTRASTAGVEATSEATRPRGPATRSSTTAAPSHHARSARRSGARGSPVPRRHLGGTSAAPRRHLGGSLGGGGATAAAAAAVHARKRRRTIVSQTAVQTRARRVPHGVCRSGFGSRARSLVRPSARRRPACRQAALPPCERKTCARVVRQPGDGR